MSNVDEIKIILASSSPRRKELLSRMGVTFEVVSPGDVEFEAGANYDMEPSELARANAWNKAEAVAAKRLGCWVIGADTVVALDGRILGKPSSLDQARFFLMELSGQTHEVITGCALICPDETHYLFHRVSEVTFKLLDRPLIDRYLAAVNVLDKAGAYALQEHGDWIIEKVKGSRTNVVGLPTEALREILQRRQLLKE